MNQAQPNIELLIVDDDASFRTDVAEYFERTGYSVTACADGRSGLEMLRTRSFDAAIIDLMMPELSGLELMKAAREAGGETPLVVLTGQGTIESAVEAMKQGASDFVSKPARLRDLDVIVKKAIETGRLRQENAQLRVALQHQQPSAEIIGNSSAIQEVFRLIDRIGPTDKTVLIQGESGTGKELVARAIHQRSKLADKPLITINCAALPDTLLESEMFGYEKGAFTGAVSAKPGLFEIADGGTLFIDEIGELASALQAKLLRVLEDGSMRRVGSIKQRRVRVRLIAATNRNLAEEVKAGRFREDLYYRINVLTLQLPPLRERLDDLLPIIEHLLTPEWTIEENVLPALRRYPWPGNVRQLRNALERAKILSDDHVVRLSAFPPEILQGSHPPLPLPALSASVCLDELNKRHVSEVYRRHGGNKSRTARALGVSRRTLYRLIEKYQIGDVNPQSN